MKINTVVSLSLEHEVPETYRRSLQGPMLQVTIYTEWAKLWLAVGYGLSNFNYELAYWFCPKLMIAGEDAHMQFFIVQLVLLVSSPLWGQMFALVTEALDDVETTFTISEKRASPGNGIRVAFKQVLHRLDLSIKPRQFAALVKPSGAGKLTIITLMERLYAPESGSIEQSLMFDGTIRFNPSLGARPSRTVTQEKLEEACKLANIHETIMQLPSGYDTYCGPNGDRLSGVRKQWLVIARALVRKPQLLLLDESTSALNAEKVMLVIAIAHRLYMIRRVDVISMILNGRCIDRCTHELIECSEIYRVNALNQAVGE
ncbi:P-loop containing nucleoside triphosphate hydrolase protein [Aspergillus homomorphus CBS 101889]|uniref:P-loop containing nucleoside triphosphate hydrolase protein n=1 Tax=Aspergillus homomorphus (strain CBS 101889) TaxID=1450537 RepID=A0A395IAT2_ASPHC|nr:P-loop containing nucleoside triphosphate hydrolase protein [Aspergillus homomorphus CBS 101889]RAL16188.1 P-loop containing nucleoside triphosphate hydrolase protein [Aspergillus homomorphus CBS 101889]